MKRCNLSIIFRRTTAFLLLLLLSVTLLSPAFVHAEDTTYAKDFTSKVYYSYTYKGLNHSIEYFYDHRICTDGKLVCITYFCKDLSLQSEGFAKFYLSTSPIYTLNYNADNTRPPETKLSLAPVYNGVYYVKAGSTYMFNGASDFKITYSGLVNIKNVDGSDWLKYLKSDIDNGYFDLTKDDYLDNEQKEPNAPYNKDLDFLTLKGDYKVKYTIEKDNDGKWNFITPDEAGILLEWTNRQDIDAAYVQISAYGEFYEGFWASTYINTGITVSNIRRNDLSYLFKQKDMVSLAKSSLNKTNGFGFVVKYMYIQSFGTVDGQFCRGRIYKLNADLVTDYGNADAENDEYFPEITDGDPMPPEYEPAPDDPDPEKTEPDPDPDDDTTIITPIPKPDEPIFDSDLDLLKALSIFFDGLKSSIALLGNFPAFIANIFGFLPSSVISLIGLSIVAVIVLRFIGR